MAQVTFSVCMGENLKRQFDSLCEDFGMNTMQAFMMLGEQAVKEFPQDIEVDEIN